MGVPVKLQGGPEFLLAQCSFSQPESDTQDVTGVAKATIDILTFARLFMLHQRINRTGKGTMAVPVPVKLVLWFKK